MANPNTRASQKQRFRTSQACNQCRRRKSKCGGEQPQCLVCQSTDRDCSYDKSSRKRGLQGGYVRSLEIALGLVLYHFPQSDKRIRSILRSQSATNDLSTPEKAEVWAKKWRESDCASVLGKTLVSTGPGHRLNSAAEDDGSDIESVLNVSESRANDIPATVASPKLQSSGHEIYTRRLPLGSAALIDLYIKQTHCWFPILKRGDLLRSMHTDIADPGGTDARYLGTRLCLWAIIAYVAASQDTADVDFDSAEIQASIRATVVIHREDYDLGHIQAILILVLSDMINGRADCAWILSAQAWRMMKTYSSRGQATGDKYNRTLRGCILMEVLLSCTLERTSCLSNRDIKAISDDFDDDSIDEWQLWDPAGVVMQDQVSSSEKQPLRSLSIFGLMLQVTTQLHNSLQDDHNPTTLLQQLSDLQTWKQNLPSYVKLCTDGPPTPPALHAHLLWCFTVCAAARALPIEARSDTWIADAIEKTLDLADEYLASNSLTGSLSLVTFFGHQGIRNIRLCSPSAQAALSRDKQDQIRRITEQLKESSLVSRTDEVAQNTQRGAGVRNEIVMVPTDLNVQPIQLSTSSAAAGRTQTQPDNQLEPVTQSGSQYLRASATGMPESNNGGRTSNNIDDFDAFLTEMPPVFPLNRPDEIPIFSQNLGFLGEDFDKYLYEELGSPFGP